MNKGAALLSFSVLSFFRHLAFGHSIHHRSGAGNSKLENQISKKRKQRQNSKRATARHRRGVSLVELLIVITVAAVIVGICATTIHVLLRSERDQSRAVRTAVTLSRLADVFREDVHAFAQVEVVSAEGQPPRLTLADGDGLQIVYSADEHLVRRSETTNGAPVHRDTFHFPSGSKVRFESDVAPRLARLAIDLAAPLPHQMPEGRNSLAPPRTVLIEAVPNRKHRFAGREP